ncbi:hypothetical protein ACA910_007444 [Epithemia clementina (nom. ined.)]
MGNDGNNTASTGTQDPSIDDKVFLQTPGQHGAPHDLPTGRHGYILQFQFHPSTNTTPQPPQSRTDTFKAVAALHSLANALFTSHGQVAIHDQQNQHHFDILAQWPSTDATFRQYFEGHTPSTGQATAYVRFGISSTLEYKFLKQEGILYSYICSNDLYDTASNLGH